MFSFDEYKPTYVALPIVALGTLFFLTFYLVDLQKSSQKPCASNPEILCEGKYNDIVNRAKQNLDPRICKEAMAYIKTERVGIAGSRESRVSEKQAENSCVQAVRESYRVKKRLLESNSTTSQSSGRVTEKQQLPETATRTNAGESKTQHQRATGSEHARMLVNFTQDEYKKLTPLEKAKLTISSNTVFDELSKTFSVTSYESKYSVYHAHGQSLAVAHVSNPKTNDPWNLYAVNEEGDEKLLFSGLTKDCCGGGMPTIKRGPASFVPVVIAKSGDACFSKLGKTYVNLRDAPNDYLRVGRSSNCESISSLSIETSEEAFKFEPILSQNCKMAEPGTEAVFSGLKASSSNNTYTKMFSNPIRMTCTEGIGDTGDALYSKTISYRGGETGIPLNKVDFRVRTYDLSTKESQSIPITFSLQEGFDE